MTLFRTGDPRPIHLMGIAGAGMSALAILARHRGVAITGWDPDSSGTGADDLTALGIPVWRGHDPRHVEGARAIVVTAAVPRDHPELEKARALGLPVVRRADALGELVAGGKEGVVAVAGTHGKTTTTVMVTEALTAARRNPRGLAGGRVAAWGGNARIGGDDLFVVEADEYDKAFLSLTPTIAVVNNVEADHLECYGSMEALEDAFVDFASRAERVIIGADDAGADRVALHVTAPVWRGGGGRGAGVAEWAGGGEGAGGVSRRRPAIRAAGGGRWRDRRRRLRASPDGSQRDARGRAAGVPGSPGDRRVSAAPVFADGVARRSARQGARGGGRGRRRADLRGARAAAGRWDAPSGGARRDPRRCGDGGGARSRYADESRRARGAGRRRRLHARRGRRHASGTRAAE